MRRSLRFGLIAAGLLASGCGGAPAAPTSPKAAIDRFLQPLSVEQRGSASGRADAKVLGFWRSLCQGVDPAIRPALRFDDHPPSPEACGGIVVLAALETSDTGPMLPAGTIHGAVTQVTRNGGRAVAGVTVHYTPMRSSRGAVTSTVDPDLAPPPAKATIQVLLVRRHAHWWVAVPQAFNPTHAAQGGMPVAAQAREHDRLVRAARRSP